MTLGSAGTSRWPGLGVTVALHLLLVAGFMLQRTATAPEPQPRWMQVFEVQPVDESGMIPDPAELPRAERLKPSVPPRSTHASPAASPQRPAGALPQAPPAEAFPSLIPAPGSLFERARAEAGKVDSALRKEFPEHPNRLRAIEKTPQQKLATRIANSLAPPKLYEAPRITAIQDQGVGWGRRIDKVVTGNGTYCITYEGNHGGDGRDVFKDALEPKIRTCPREE